MADAKGSFHEPRLRRNRYRLPIAALVLSLWLTGLVAIGASQLYYVYAILASLAWGALCGAAMLVVCYGPWLRRWWLTLAVLIIGVAAILIGSIYVEPFGRHLTWDPIGEASDLGPGAPPCEVTAIKQIRSDHQSVAELRRSFCDIDFGVSTTNYFLFVHRIGEPDTRGNLVFRYSATSTGFDKPPALQWRSANMLSVILYRRNVAVITKQKRLQDDVTIVYGYKNGKS